MKKIISLIILSLIFKGYVSTCTKGADNKCTGNVEGTSICVLDGENCVEKTLCSKVQSASAETCNEGVSLNPKKKCGFKTGDSTCSESDKTCEEIVDGASDDICLSVAVTGENGCKYDSTNKKCIESAKCKTFTPVSDGKTCTNLPTTNTVTLKCVFNTNKCDEEAKKCSEITFGGTDEICSKAVVSDDNKFKCAAENDKCKEVAKDASSSSKNSTKSSTSSKSEEKNGANYAKLSLGLLGLLFF